MSVLEQNILQTLQSLEQSGALRKLPQPKDIHPSIDLSTNDYLCLTQHSAIKKRFEAYGVSDFSASSSRLLSGNHLYYKQVESKLFDYYNKSALFFNSGYHLNIGVLPSLTSKHDLILADKQVHASLIEGLRLSYAKVLRYKHLDYHHLEHLLEQYANDYQNVFIVTESVFSMDGDCSDLKHLVQLKKKYGAYLYVDEAHAVGVYGAKGLGLSEELGVLKEVDFLVGTMGKALASVGAFLICNEPIKQYLVNRCRSLIYTTALPPINMAWTLSVLEQLPDLKKERESLQQNCNYLREILIKNKIPFMGESHILAIITGDNSSCLELYKSLNTKGIKVQAVRPPTVPQGTARLRLSLHSSLSKSDLDDFAMVLKEMFVSQK